MNEEEEVVLICAAGPVRNSDIPGSTDEICNECGEEVVIAPSGQKIRDEQNAKVICIGCATKLIKEEGAEARYAPPTAEQKEEAMNAIKTMRLAQNPWK